MKLGFAFILVSLNHWKQLTIHYNLIIKWLNNQFESQKANSFPLKIPPTSGIFTFRITPTVAPVYSHLELFSHKRAQYYQIVCP